MSCDLLQNGILDEYAAGELGAAEAREVEAHLFGCSQCATELRALRAERRLFRARAEEAPLPVPSFEGVLARIAHEGTVSVTSADEGAVVAALPPARGASARLVRSAGEKKVSRAPGGKGPGWASRVAPAVVAIAALSAAAASWVGVLQRPPEVSGEASAAAGEVEIVPEAICAADAPISVEVPWSAAPAPEMGACGPESACGAADPEAHPAESCGESVAWCSAISP